MDPKPPSEPPSGFKSRSRIPSDTGKPPSSSTQEPVGGDETPVIPPPPVLPPVPPPHPKSTTSASTENKGSVPTGKSGRAGKKASQQNAERLRKEAASKEIQSFLYDSENLIKTFDNMEEKGVEIDEVSKHLKVPRPDQLMAQKRKLKSVNRSSRFDPVKLGRRELLKDYDWNMDYLPLPVALTSVRDASITSDLVSLDFSGMEQVTDYLFYIFKITRCSFPSMQKFVSTGCVHLSDQGIQWLAELCPKLTAVEVQGCERVTEKGLYMLANSCPDLHKLTITATGVTRLPSKLSDTKVSTITYEGCPLISSSANFALSTINIIKSTEDTGVFWRLPSVKIVLLRHPDVDVSITSFITGSPNQKPSKSVTFTNDFRPERIGEDKPKLNIVELPSDHSLVDGMVTQGCTVVIAFPATDSASLVTTDIITNLASTCASVLTKCRDTTISLLCVDQGKMTVDVKDIEKMVVEKLQEWQTAMFKYFDHQTGRFWRLENVDFVSQLSHAAGGADHERVDDITSKSGIKISSISVQSRSESEKIVDFLYETVAETVSRYPWIYDAYRKEIFDVMTEIRPRTYWTLNKVYNNMAVDARKLLNPRNCYQHVGKLLELMATMGKALYYPGVREQPCVTDLPHLEKILHSLHPAPDTVHIKCLGPGVACWSEASLRQHLLTFALNDVQVEGLLTLLVKLGLLLLFSGGDNNIYVLTSDLPKQPAVELTDVWPDTVSSDECRQGSRHYTFLPGITPGFFQHFLRKCVRVFPPMLVWRTGVLLQQGPVFILVELAAKSGTKRDGCPVISVSGRMSTHKMASLSCSKYARQCLHATLHVVCQLLDSLLRKHNVFAIVTTPCISCMKGKPRQAAYKRDIVYHFEVPLILAGHDRGITCRYERGQTGAKIRADKLLLLGEDMASMVPHHNYGYLAAINPLIETGDPGEDEREGEVVPHKKITASPRIDRCCICRTGQRHLCHHCGMCQDCVHNLAAVENYVKPSFITPSCLAMKDMSPRKKDGKIANPEQYLASDHISTGVAGCVLWTNKGMEFDLLQPMTTTYFNTLTVQPIRGANLLITLRTKVYARAAEYAVLSGTICNEFGDVNSDDDNWKCRDGFTITINILQTKLKDMRDVVIYLCGQEIWRRTFSASEFKVSIRSEVTGCVVLHAPGIKRRQGPVFQPWMHVGIVTQDKHWTEVEGMRIGEVCVPDSAAIGLLKVKPVHTPVTDCLVTVLTGDKEDCGTTANIFIQLFGSLGTSEKIELKRTSDEMFQMNSEDEFRIQTRDIGDITDIKLSHDGLRVEDSWYVKSVTINTLILEYSTTFLCNCWLSAHREDKQTERIFRPTTSRMTASDALQEMFNPLSDKLQPLSLQQWTEIMGGKLSGEASKKQPLLAPPWLFYETQLRSDFKKFVPTNVQNVNEWIMPCTSVPLPSVVWCKMMKMRDKLERTLFQYAQVDFSGSSSILLPQEVTEKAADWPTPSLVSAPANMHPVCYVRGDMNTVVTLRPCYTLPDYMRSFWTAHLVSAPGFPFTLDADHMLCVPVLWAWHFVLALNRQFKLPDYRQVFPNSESLPDSDKVNLLIESYLTLMSYHLYLLLEPDFSLNFFNEENEEKAEQAIGLVRYPMLENFEKTGLVKKTTLFGEDEIYLCSSHLSAWQTSTEITEVPLPQISDYSPYMFTLHLQGNKITSVPKELFIRLPHLKDLDLSTNQIIEIPDEIGLCTKMLNLSLRGNELTSLPDSIENMRELNRLDISNNRMREVPACVTKLSKLVCLYIKTMQLLSLPEDIGNLTLLEKLYLNENCIHYLPESFKKLKNLKELAMNGVSWVKIKSNTILSKANFENTLKAANLTHWLSANEQDKSAIFKYFDENTNGTLEPKEIGKLNATIFFTFPRFGYMGTEPPDEDMPHGFPEELLELESLEYLSLQYQGLVAVPEDIHRLKHLKVLNLSHNPYLLSVPAQAGSLPLKRLELDECPLLKTPPKEIRAKGFTVMYAYLKRLLSGSVECQRTKLMMVGLGGAGKTSLVKALLSGSHKTKLTVGEDITDGIDICPWTVKTEEGQLTYSIWDFAGQTVYYNTHQFFLSDRAIYMLLWNIRLGHEHAGLDFWLSSIRVHAPKAPIFVVGTHVDQVSKVELPVREMQQRYPQIAGFHFISSHSGQGVKELQSELLDVTLQQSYMGEKIPGVWLSFEEQIKKLKESSVIEYKELEKKANLAGIFDKTEVYQAVQFLHELGSLQYFTNEYLKAYVVVNPQWIVDVMSCVVSVKDSHIKDGRLEHSDIASVWQDYPETLHSWMIRLTEEFDLTFPLASEQVNLVPCLLPEREPEISWPELDKQGSVKETKMVYKFDYLPAGLFNRGQVRLHQFSDSSMIWKRGSFLRKNKHICLIKQTRESEMVVVAQGPRPDNLVFLVHEVFETLIAESFHGVTYDFHIPCPDCLKLVLKEPHMFAASTIRRATELRAPFLQCMKYFHTISIVELQGMMPPDTNTDYDIHLVQAVQGLKELSKDVVADIFVSYCNQDTPEDLSNKIFVHPSLVCTDLEKAGFRCWFRGDSSQYTTDEMAKALMDSGVVVVFISNEYVKDETCCNLFKYARLTLRKPIILVVVGSGMEWKASRLGILLADEVFVSMLQVNRYDAKFEELMKVLKLRMKKKEKDSADFPPCFISYCWKNSAQAVARGTKTTESALGYGDPRGIKQHLDDHDIPCWLDVERVGLHGLFEDIAEGLLQAKVVIVCVSDEYAASPNCTMEFRYAANTLKLPVVMAVVGTGSNWRASEIGVLSLNFPIVSFQEKTAGSYDKLLSIVRGMLPDPDSYSVARQQEKRDKESEEQKNLSFQELCELAQRKFLRQVVQYADEQDIAAPYPRLFLIDFVRQQTGDTDGTAVSESLREDSQSQRDLLKHPMCVHTLCEHDEGWHSVSDPLPISLDVTTLERCVPYIARITAIARYSRKLVLHCLETTAGHEFIKWLEENPQVVDCSDFRQIYHDLRQEVISADPDRTMGNLARCHLASGKTSWLCEEHRKKMRVTVLSDEVSVTFHGTSDLGGVDYMLQGMRDLDFDKVPNAIRKMGRQRSPKTAKSQENKDKTFNNAVELSHKGQGDTTEMSEEDRPISNSSQASDNSQPSKIQTQPSQRNVSAAQRSLKTRASAGRPKMGTRTKSKACSLM